MSNSTPSLPSSLAAVTLVPLRTELLNRFRDEVYEAFDIKEDPVVGVLKEDQVEMLRQNAIQTFCDYFEDYFVRSEWGRQRRIQPWALVNRNDSHEQKLIFSYCTSRRFDTSVRKASGEILPSYSYVVESVCTLKNWRGRGYATHMCRILHYILSGGTIPWPKDFGDRPPHLPKHVELPAAKCSLLLSGIGKEFYEKCWIGDGNQRRVGWDFHDSTTVLNMGYAWTFKDAKCVDDSRSTPPKVWATTVKLGKDSPVPTWGWSWVFQHELASLSAPAREATLRRLADQKLDGKDIMVTNHIGASRFEHFETYSRLGLNPARRKRYHRDQPVGVRFYPLESPSGDTTNHSETKARQSSPLFRPHHPICLFYPNAVFPGTVHVVLMSNIPPALLPELVWRIREAAPDCNKLTGWGLDFARASDGGDSDLLAAMRDGGCQFYDRTSNKTEMDMPWGVAWYCDRNERAIWKGQEWWTFG